MSSLLDCHLSRLPGMCGDCIHATLVQCCPPSPWVELAQTLGFCSWNPLLQWASWHMQTYPGTASMLVLHLCQSHRGPLIMRQFPGSWWGDLLSPSLLPLHTYTRTHSCTHTHAHIHARTQMHTFSHLIELLNPLPPLSLLFVRSMRER